MPKFTPGQLACRDLLATHGRTYYRATQLLPSASRPGVYALYGFARLVDDVVDLGTSPAEAVRALDLIETATTTGEVSGLDEHAALVTGEYVGTLRQYNIPADHTTAFLRSMRMDIPGTPGHRSRYRTMAQLRDYMYGSAAVIGLQLIPLLGVRHDADLSAALDGAAALGEAFQLTNFLRDVAEDLDRGRIYLPLDELAAFGVTEATLADQRARGRVTPAMRKALRHFIAVARSDYRRATVSADLLVPRSAACVRAALLMYAEILTEIEKGGYEVFAGRCTVPNRRRAWLTARAVTGSLTRP